jgi:hypothetical protein
MSLTLFLNTFGSSTRVKWGISNIEVTNNNNYNNTDNNTYKIKDIVQIDKYKNYNSTVWDKTLHLYYTVY